MRTPCLPDDVDAYREASADQREMVRLMRLARSEICKRIPDIGCMNPDEILSFLESLDQLIDLHNYAHSLDDRLEATREKLNRLPWTD